MEGDRLRVVRRERGVLELYHRAHPVDGYVAEQLQLGSAWVEKRGWVSVRVRVRVRVMARVWVRVGVRVRVRVRARVRVRVRGRG